VPGKQQPTQKMFDSLLLRQLQQFDPGRPVWVESESKKIGRVQLPDALLGAMRSGQTIAVDAPMPQRVQLLREDYAHFEQDPKSMISRLAFLRPLIGREEFAVWEDLAERREVPALFERLMRNHYDPTYRRSILRNYPEIDKSPKIQLEDLSMEGLIPVAKELRARFDVAADQVAA
jgi:tRNA 2-selenouridine synthase